MHWSDSFSTHIWIFNVGRGNAAFLRSGLNQGFIIDMAEGEDFDAAGFLEKRLVPHLSRYQESNIAQALLSHPHNDHIAQCARLASDYKKGVLYPSLLTCPHDKDPLDGAESNEKLNWRRIVNPQGTDELIAAYRDLYAKRILPLQTIQFESKLTIPNLEYCIYYVRPPACEVIHPNNDQEYGNSTSIMFYFRCGDNSILFPGDMTPEGMKHILAERKGAEKRYTRFDRRFTEDHPRWHRESSDQPSLKSLLKSHGLTILVAPHQGLESCFSSELYAAMHGGKPQLVVISEKRHTTDQDGKVHQQYQSENGATGLNVEIEGKTQNRRSLSTISGQHILVVFKGNGSPRVYAERDPEKLLSRINA